MFSKNKLLKNPFFCCIAIILLLSFITIFSYLLTPGANYTFQDFLSILFPSLILFILIKYPCMIFYTLKKDK